jgi:hypothetical protein
MQCLLAFWALSTGSIRASHWTLETAKFHNVPKDTVSELCQWKTHDLLNYPKSSNKTKNKPKVSVVRNPKTSQNADVRNDSVQPNLPKTWHPKFG